MTFERKYAFEPCCMLVATLIRRLLRIMRSRRHFVSYHGVELFIGPADCADYDKSQTIALGESSAVAGVQ